MTVPEKPVKTGSNEWSYRRFTIERHPSKKGYYGYFTFGRHGSDSLRRTVAVIDALLARRGA